MRHLLEASLEIDNIVMHLFCQYRCLSLLLLMMLLLWVFFFFFSFFSLTKVGTAVYAVYDKVFFIIFFKNLFFCDTLACRPSNQWIRCIMSFFLFVGGGVVFSLEVLIYIFFKESSLVFLWLQSHHRLVCRDSSLPTARPLPFERAHDLWFPAVEAAWLECDNHFSKSEILRKKSPSRRRVLKWEEHFFEKIKKRSRVSLIRGTDAASVECNFLE